MTNQRSFPQPTCPSTSCGELPFPRPRLFRLISGAHHDALYHDAQLFGGSYNVVQSVACRSAGYCGAHFCASTAHAHAIPIFAPVTAFMRSTADLTGLMDRPRHCPEGPGKEAPSDWSGVDCVRAIPRHVHTLFKPGPRAHSRHRISVSVRPLVFTLLRFPHDSHACVPSRRTTRQLGRLLKK